MSNMPLLFGRSGPMRPLLLASMLAGNATAQPCFPSKPISIVVPTTPGGGSDHVARLIAAALSRHAGWTLVVDNRPGATGTRALAEVARQKGDGHELVMGMSSNVAFAPAWMKPGFDPVADLVPVAYLADSPLVALVAETSPYKSWKAFVDAAGRSARRFTYGTTGNGSSSHVMAERLRLDHGVKITHVPYKGSPQALLDLANGHIDMAFTSLAAALPLLRSRKLLALASTSPERNPVLPNVPTFTELGYAPLEHAEWYGLFAPKGTPSTVADQINVQVNKVLALPEVRDAALAQGQETKATSWLDFVSMVRADARVAKAAVWQVGIKTD